MSVRLDNQILTLVVVRPKKRNWLLEWNFLRKFIGLIGLIGLIIGPIGLIGPIDPIKTSTDQNREDKENDNFGKFIFHTTY